MEMFLGKISRVYGGDKTTLTGVRSFESFQNAVNLKNN